MNFSRNFYLFSFFISRGRGNYYENYKNYYETYYAIQYYTLYTIMKRNPFKKKGIL